MGLVIANLVRGSVLCFTILCSCLAGCGSAPVGASPPAWSNWAQRQGGMLEGVPQQRAGLALGRVNLSHDPNVAIHVLASDRVGAWSWRDGTIFVTDGLLRLLDDDELAATVSHELGHLAARTRGTAVAALDGAVACESAEQNADAEGCRILRAAGISTDCLGSALRKVRDLPGVSEPIRRSLDTRLQLLSLRAAAP